MSSPNKFAVALNAGAGTEEAPILVDASQAALVESEGVAAVKSESPHMRPSRRQTKHIGGHFDPAVSRQLRQLGLEEDTTVQDLIGEALDMLFHSRQLPPIASKKG